MLSKKVLSNFLPLILIVILASVLRLLWLDKVPSSIGGDELVYIFNAKAMYLTGHDVFGGWSPWQAFFFILPKGDASAELLYFLSFPFVGPFNFSLLTARLPGAILSILTVLALYFVTKELFDKKVALIAASVAAVNPWLVYIGRTLYEANPAMFFYLMSLLVLLKTKGMRIFWSLPFLLLAFYSYIGTKIILIPFVLAGIAYCYFVQNKKIYVKHYAAVLLFSIVVVLVYFISLQLHPVTAVRLEEIITPNNPDIVKQVNDLRRGTMINPLLNLLVNKYTVFANILIVKYLKSFSTEYLFINGDQFFSIWRHGLFYYIDSIFILLGTLFLFVKKRAVFVFIAVLILIGVFPQVIHGASTDNYTLHLTLLFPFLIILAALGIYETVALFKHKRLKTAAAVLIFFIYLISVANFLNIYFFWWPLQGYFDFQVRLLSKYVALAKAKGGDVAVYSSQNPDIFKKYLFYTNGFNKDTYLNVRNVYKKNDFTFENVKFLGCDNTRDFSTVKTTVLYDSFSCGNLIHEQAHLSLARLSDGGESYQIYNDKVCGKYNLKKFPSGLNINDFSIENQSAQQFCETFVTRL